MNPFKRKKKETDEKREVEYEQFGDNAYHIKSEIDGERLDIIAYSFPEEKKTNTKAAVDAGLKGAKVEGEQDKAIKGSWDAVVKTETHGYLPLETWKKVAEQVSSTITVATGSTVNPTDINVYMSAPISTLPQCKKCGTPLFIIGGGIKCPKCGNPTDDL